jgi:hypothetical protein
MCYRCVKLPLGLARAGVLGKHESDKDEQQRTRSGELGYRYSA